jgi:hypothetical protein
MNRRQSRSFNWLTFNRLTYGYSEVVKKNRPLIEITGIYLRKRLSKKGIFSSALRLLHPMKNWLCNDDSSLTDLSE